MLPEKKQIFIVDDDESVCRSLKLLMGTYGFLVETFPSADKFFSAVPNSALGCLIMDIHMPGLDGWATQKKVIESGSKRPVIFISAEKQDHIADRAFKAGAMGFLQKPFDGQTLVDLIKVASESKTTNN